MQRTIKHFQIVSSEVVVPDNQFLNEERSGVGAVAVPEFVSGVEVDPNKVKVEALPQQSQMKKSVNRFLNQADKVVESVLFL